MHCNHQWINTCCESANAYPIALLIGVYDPSICGIAVLNTNVQNIKEHCFFIIKAKGRSNVCILVALSHYLFKQNFITNKVYFHFSSCATYINLHLILSDGRMQVLLSNG